MVIVYYLSKAFAINREQLLDNIGTAQMSEEFVARVRKLVLKNQQMLEVEVGISTAINEKNLKELIMEELRKNR